MGVGRSNLLECACLDRGSPKDALDFDALKILAQGSNKFVCSGTLNGEDVVVCCCRSSKGEDIKRAKNEIAKLTLLGRHPHIIQLMSHGILYKKPYLVLEMVQPVGFDLARLWSQYEPMGGKVPSSLCGRLFRQLVGALQHMHGKQILHLDLKTENVLVTLGYNAKLCDFGIACEVGSFQHLKSGYMPPEVCNGASVGPEADSWGLGLILHQMYQRGAWNLVDCHSKPCRLRQEALRCISGMPTHVQQVMRGLIKQEPSERLTLQGIMESGWLSKDVAEFETPTDEWFGLPRFSLSSSQWSVPYHGSSRPLTLSVLIGTKQTQLFGHTLGSLGLCQDSSKLSDPQEQVHVLLVRQPGPSGQAITNPSPDIEVKAGMRIFVGVPDGTEHIDVALQRIYHQLDLTPQSAMSSTCTSSCQSGRRKSTETAIMEYGLHKENKKGKREICESGAMYSFAMEFDCFTFPRHIGDEATIGKDPMAGPGRAFTGELHLALDLKGTFNINLVGIQRVGEPEVEWFPDGSALVRPGDLGLIARCPCEDGCSVPALEANTLAMLLDKEEFKKTLRVKSGKQVEDTAVVMNSQFSDVLAYKKPVPGAAQCGRIPNGTTVKVEGHYGDFILVRSEEMIGWVGLKNVREA